jgi:hypothetical protein
MCSNASCRGGAVRIQPVPWHGEGALDARRTGAAVDVPFTAIDLINGFNEWKKSETAGRVFVVDQRGVAEIGVTGLPWRDQVCQQVDAGWSEFARQLVYKSRWHGATLIKADRWYSSSQICWRCGTRKGELQLTDRVVTCECGHKSDRDLNAAVNLARSGETQTSPPGPPSTEAGSSMPADEKALVSTSGVPTKPARVTRELTFTPHHRREPTTPEKGGAEPAPRSVDTLKPAVSTSPCRVRVAYPTRRFHPARASRRRSRPS